MMAAAAIDPSLEPTDDNNIADMDVKTIPPISSAMPQPLQPSQDYRALPPPQQMYAPAYPPPMGYAPAQPAPRQRTAIACRYCRRRKIRCSGFDQSEDGRCTNCQRFSQECVFTPVSAQTQAFVPAHTVYRGQQPPPNTQLYGAYGQPLPHQGQQQPGQYPPQQQPGQPGQYPPPPGYAQQQPMYQQPPPQGTPQQAGQKRGNDEPHTPTLPPPPPGSQTLTYPEPPTGLNSGASPSFPYTSMPLQSQYPTAPFARASPQSAHSFESRASSSPRTVATSVTSMSTHGANGAAVKLDERSFADTRQDNMSVASDGMPRMRDVKDAGVQTGDDLPPIKEPVS